MAARIQKLAKQALVTFSGSTQSASFATNLENLKSMMDGISPSDLNLSIPAGNGLAAMDHFSNGYSRAPATHVSIFECQQFTLGVFILHHGCAIPLHDHPGMFGICKVLYGEVNIRSFDKVPQVGKSDDVKLYRPSAFPLKCKVREQTFNENTGSCFLTPTFGNLHTIVNNRLLSTKDGLSLELISHGSTAFLDILAPPYDPDEGRDCTYFRECDQDTNMKLSHKHGLSPEERESKLGISRLTRLLALVSCLQLINRVRWLVQMPPPREFFCDAEPYRGPRIEFQ